MLEPRSPFPRGSCLGIVQILWNLAVQVCSKQAVKKKWQIWYYLAGVSHLLLHKRHTKSCIYYQLTFPFSTWPALLVLPGGALWLYHASHGDTELSPAPGLALALGDTQHHSHCQLGTGDTGISSKKAVEWGSASDCPQKSCCPLVRQLWQCWQHVLVSSVVFWGKKGEY